MSSIEPLKKREQFLWMPREVWRNLFSYPIPKGAVITYTEMRLNANQNGYCRLLESTIAKNTKSSERSIREHISMLKSHELIKKQYRRGPHCCAFMLNMQPQPFDERPEENCQSVRGKERRKIASQIVKDRQKAVERLAKNRHQSKKYPIEQHSNKGACDSETETKRKTTAKKTGDFEDKFEELWNYYPRKEKKRRGMKKCEGLIQSKEISFEELLTAIKEYAACPYVQSRIDDSEEKKFIPLFSTWLEDRAWNGEERAGWMNARKGWTPLKIMRTKAEQTRKWIIEELTDRVKIMRTGEVEKQRDFIKNREDLKPIHCRLKKIQFQSKEILDGSIVDLVAEYKALARERGVTINV